ncbi:SCO4983 family protein [Streptomyces cylindrosporus]|uniref:Uncharacterized protein n=1 Tax=Streptomyces cylindrosporus TaxID=2927583 RepID=A0ABS9Y696_9ACTN|nr:hypothetical protein [Streptomyces cylindrosporus]MCI3272752.1 hypothetical protein [Streptomyces cylindrosporus]
MYEPIRTKSVHSTMAGTTSDFPHRSREEELDIQLAGHLAALLAVTDELRALAPAADLDTAAERLAEQVSRLRGGTTPVRMSVVPADDDPLALHERAHALAGRALVVAASRADTAVAILAAEQMDVHAAALEPRELASR